MMGNEFGKAGWDKTEKKGLVDQAYEMGFS